MLTKEQEHKAQMKLLEQEWAEFEKSIALENHNLSLKGMDLYGLPYRVCLDYYKTPLKNGEICLNLCYPFPGFELSKRINVTTNDFEYVKRSNRNIPLRTDELFNIDNLKENKKIEVARVMNECRTWVKYDTEWERVFLHFLKGYDFDTFTEFDFYGTKNNIEPGDISLLRNVYKRLQNKYNENPNDYMQSEPLEKDYDTDLYDTIPFHIVWSDEELEEQRRLEEQMNIGKEKIPSTLPYDFTELEKLYNGEE